MKLSDVKKKRNNKSQSTPMGQCWLKKNRCWNRIGSPPPAASKNEVLKLRSVNNIVIAPAKTGRDNNNKTAVITTAQPNSANFVPQKRINVYRIRPYLD